MSTTAARSIAVPGRGMAPHADRVGPHDLLQHLDETILNTPHRPGNRITANEETDDFEADDRTGLTVQ
jgi:hypothetical protein